MHARYSWYDTYIPVLYIPIHDRRTVCERFKQLLLVGLSYKNTYVSYVCTETFREEDPSLAIKYIISISTNIFNIIAKPGSSASIATPTAFFKSSPRAAARVLYFTSSLSLLVLERVVRSE